MNTLESEWGLGRSTLIVLLSSFGREAWQHQKTYFLGMPVASKELFEMTRQRWPTARQRPWQRPSPSTTHGAVETATPRGAHSLLPIALWWCSSFWNPPLPSTQRSSVSSAAAASIQRQDVAHRRSVTPTCGGAFIRHGMLFHFQNNLSLKLYDL